MLRDVVAQAEKEIEEFVISSLSIRRDNIPDILKYFKNLRILKDKIDEIQKMVDTAYNKMSKEVIPDAFEKIKMDNCKMHGVNFIISSRMWASVPERQEEEGFAWLRKNDYGMLIRERVNAQQLSSAMTGLFKEKNLLPPQEAVTIAVEKHTSIRK